MTKELVDYWSRLQTTVHPEDAETLAGFGEHGLNLDYPPPAFIGDVVRSRVVILDNNGGYDPVLTPAEFSQPGSHERHRLGLAQALRASPGPTSPYYLARNFAAWLMNGQASLVNGLAYRSKDGRAPGIAQLSKVLPSAAYHRKWLLESLMPLVESGEKCLVVHRWARWNGVLDTYRGKHGVIFSSASISKDLTAQELTFVRDFLS